MDKNNKKRGFILLNAAKQQFRQRRNYLTGFTLVETLVALSVFTLVIGIVFNIFVYVLQSQRKALAYQELLDQTSFAIEYMTRSIRMAKKQRTLAEPINPACIPVGRNYQPIADNHLRFIRWDYVGRIFICYEFRLHNGKLQRSRDRGNPNTWVDLTSPGLEVTNLRFQVIGDGPQTPPLQPRVTIVLEVRGREYTPGRRAVIHLQTTVSQRDLDL